MLLLAEFPNAPTTSPALLSPLRSTRTVRSHTLLLISSCLLVLGGKMWLEVCTLFAICQSWGSSLLFTGQFSLSLPQPILPPGDLCCPWPLSVPAWLIQFHHPTGRCSAQGRSQAFLPG